MMRRTLSNPRLKAGVLRTHDGLTKRKLGYFSAARVAAHRSHNPESSSLSEQEVLPGFYRVRTYGDRFSSSTRRRAEMARSEALWRTARRKLKRPCRAGTAFRCRSKNNIRGFARGKCERYRRRCQIRASPGDASEDATKFVGMMFAGRKRRAGFVLRTDNAIRRREGDSRCARGEEALQQQRTNRNEADRDALFNRSLA
jgi:hypothetical protein